mmetsp:Transcript_42271/g.136257  ORF Transcript_42271/g.136257 Transcript_42271/m.136257 type:complete len:336 (+) Transcript_42271:620-1627(+)
MSECPHTYMVYGVCAMRHAVHLNHLVARLHVLLLYTILAFKMPHPSHALVCTTAHTTRIRQKTGQFLTRSPSYLGRDRETVHRRAACVGDGASAQAAAAARPRSTGRAAQLEARRSDRRKVVEGGVLILILGGQSLGGGRRCSGRLGGGCVGGAARQGRVGEDAGAGHDFDLHLALLRLLDELRVVALEVGDKVGVQVALGLPRVVLGPLVPLPLDLIHEAQRPLFDVDDVFNLVLVAALLRLVRLGGGLGEQQRLRLALPQPLLLVLLLLRALRLVRLRLLRERLLEHRVRHRVCELLGRLGRRRAARPRLDHARLARIAVALAVLPVVLVVLL